jgi:hypothetical protein
MINLSMDFFLQFIVLILLILKSSLRFSVPNTTTVSIFKVYFTETILNLISALLSSLLSQQHLLFARKSQMKETEEGGL